MDSERTRATEPTSLRRRQAVSCCLSELLTLSAPEAFCHGERWADDPKCLIITRGQKPIVSDGVGNLMKSKVLLNRPVPILAGIAPASLIAREGG